MPVRHVAFFLSMEISRLDRICHVLRIEAGAENKRVVVRRDRLFTQPSHCLPHIFYRFADPGEYNTSGLRIPKIFP